MLALRILVYLVLVCGTVLVCAHVLLTCDARLHLWLIRKGRAHQFKRASYGKQGNEIGFKKVQRCLTNQKRHVFPF
jgi:hypothetical protein